MLAALHETFLVNRKLTYDLLDVLNDEDLVRNWPRPGLNTFTKHFAEMAEVQESFILAMQRGTMDFSNVPDVFNFPEQADRESLRASLEQSDVKLSNVLSNVESGKQVDWFGTPCPVEIHLTNLIAHEVFHQGQMAMALYTMNLPIPSSWQESWSMPDSLQAETADD